MFQFGETQKKYIVIIAKDNKINLHKTTFFTRYALLIFLLVCGEVTAKTLITEVRLDGDTAKDEFKFYAADTWIRIGKLELPVTSYIGPSADGLANGFGKLTFGTNWGSAKSQMKNFDSEAQIYTGVFKDGRPVGIGRMGNEWTGMFLEKDFTSDLLQRMNVLVNGRVVLTVPTEGDSLYVDGPVKMAIYPVGSSQPSKVFYGTIKNGIEKGEWISVPWVIPRPGGEMVGFKNHISEPGFEPGERIVCEIKLDQKASDAPPRFKDLAALARSGKHSFIHLDPIYQSRTSVNVCEARASNGWVHRYNWSVTDAGVYKSKLISCADSNGTPGTISAGSKGYSNCTVVYPGAPKKDNNFFAKIGRELKRTPGNIVKGITHTVNEVGGEFETFICDVAGKEPGKDCHVNVSGGVTFNSPAEKVESVESELQHRNNISSTRKLKERIHEQSSKQPNLTWASNAADLYFLCVESCGNSSKRQYSMGMMDLMNRSLIDPEIGTTNYRSLASFDRDWNHIGNEILSAVPVVSKVYAFYQSAKTVSKFDDALLEIQILPKVHSLSPKGIERYKIFNELYKMKMDLVPDLYNSGLQVWAEFLTIGTPGVADILPNNKYVQILNLYKIDSVQFFKKYKKMKKQEEFWDAIIAEKLNGLN